MTILKQAARAVTDRRARYVVAMDYYEGNVPEVFATAKLRKLFATAQDGSKLNFCRPIVSAVANRIEIASISGDTKDATNKLKEVWDYNDLSFESDEIHTKTLIYGESYAMVWPDADGKLVISHQSPETTAIVYDPEDPRKKLYGVKMWLAAENETRMNIYTSDSIRKYKANTAQVSEATDWTYLDAIDNPFGEVPIFHFKTQRPFGRPEHFDAYDAQNAINKLFVTNMNTIDYQGAPQRYALANPDASNDFDDNDADNLDSLRNGPGELWYLKGVDKVGEFTVADHENFWGPMKEIIRSMSALTDTPLHFFERTGNSPTGNGLRVAEAPLLKKIAQREASFGHTWREIMKFVLKVEGLTGNVSIYWKTHEALDEMERWDVSLKKINAGLSHRQALREGGYAPEEIEKIMAERQQEAADGLYYQRAPQTRVNLNADETKDIA